MLGWLLDSGSSDKSSYDNYGAYQRKDGKTDNYFGSGKKGDSQHGHAVVKEDGSLSYLRDVDGTVLYDDKK